MHEKISGKQMNDKDPQFKGREEEISTLSQALYHFDLSASRLQDSYQQLQQRIEMLNLELEEKNKQLELNLRERARDEEYLSNILESLKSGVVVVDGKGEVKTFNRAAERITGIARGEVEGEYFNQAIKPLLPDDFTRVFPAGDSIKSEGEFKLKRRGGERSAGKILGHPFKRERKGVGR